MLWKVACRCPTFFLMWRHFVKEVSKDPFFNVVSPIRFSYKVFPIRKDVSDLVFSYDIS